MPRRFTLNPDYLQSVPREARQRAAQAHSEATRPARNRQAWARLIGGATIASILAFALAIAPGENPDYQHAKKTLAQGLKMRDNPNHSHDKARATNQEKRKWQSMRNT